MEEIKHFSHENPPLNLINSEMIVGARFDGGDKKTTSHWLKCMITRKAEIHKTCASLTHTINLPHHPNQKLVLVYSLPEIFFNFWYYCEICNEYIQQNEWLYHSANCRYFVHIRCALNIEQPSGNLSTSFVDEDIEDLLEIPMLEAFTDPLKLLNLC
uniref:DC1 domain-containing protein n=1 Tax=Lactuca sativa TaxID=4236 RepID=A0A9R1XEK9_LACSA|nr:hypothetical protein LSAT_V11C500247180 [Lactuca sativa]